MVSLLAASATVLAGPLAVRGPDGTRWRINDDDEPVLLERLAPNGALDSSFGRHGRVPLDFGGADASVSALRVDTTGRIWLAATTTGTGSSAPLVQRLLPAGQPDNSWGAGGRSIATPAGQRLMVVDLLPQPDGGAWVSANLFGPQGENDAGLWHLKPNGTLDYGFGLGGLWKRPGGERSRALSLADGPDGSVAVGLEVLTGRQPGREVYLVKPGERQLPQAVPALPGSTDDEEDDAYLLWDGARWLWRPGPQTAELAGLPVLSIGAAAAPAAASSPAEAGHIALNPFAEPAPAASAAESAAASDDMPWGWLAAGVIGAALLGFVWWRGRGPARG
ncbi:hypothetical protein [Ideonella sp.]|uniref:hypothetical protein n=1 Tax=Ideonella sp. TaxID=1929293 RepID=UPI002B4A55D1|nr:hypothetical protein [Ideonella sp.]HJV70423.1 hypothetical protein [Ideonella sp.]